MSPHCGRQIFGDCCKIVPLAFFLGNGVFKRQYHLYKGSCGFGDLDWIGLTKLTPLAFVDELAAFCGCGRVQRGDLVASQFAGAELSSRFLREGRLFPYEDFIWRYSAANTAGWPSR
jgi:hypothetical protein